MIDMSLINTQTTIIGSTEQTRYIPIDKTVENVPTDNYVMLLEVDMIRNGFNVVQLFVKPLIDDELNLDIRAVQCNSNECIEETIDTAVCTQDDPCYIDYIHPKRFRIYGKYSNKSGNVQVIGELGKV